MNEAFKTLQALQDTPIPNLLVIGGMVLLFLALVGRIGVIIELTGKRQGIAGVIGTLLLFFGLGLFILDQQPPSSTDTPTATPTATQSPSPTDTLTAIPSPISPKPPADASRGDTWTRPNDDMTMVYVPGGSFQMGSTDDDPDARDDQKPQHEVTLDAFWIDRTEVTVAMFRDFVQSTNHQTTAEREGWRWAYVASAGERQQVNGADSQNPHGPEGAGTQENHPVVQVSWVDAAAYCQWAEGRLPIEAEWEYAARGPEGLIYPWGDTFDGNLVNLCDANCSLDWKDINYDDGYEFTAPVGTYPDGASWVGALDMAGNVWEWVNDWYDRYPGTTYESDNFGTQFKVLRGGGLER